MAHSDSDKNDLSLPTPEPIDPDASVVDPDASVVDPDAGVVDPDAGVVDPDAGGTPPAPDVDDEIPSEFGTDDPGAPEVDAPEPEPEAEPAPAVEPPPAPAGQPPTPPAQAVPGTPPPPHTGAEAPKRKTPWGWIIGCTCGGCVLIVILLVVGVIVSGMLATKTAPEMGQEDTHFDTDADEGTYDTEHLSLGPGQTEALRLGETLKPGWIAEVHSSSADFEQVTLYLGPTAGDPRRWAKIKWDTEADGYTVVEEGEIAPGDGVQAPASGTQPGEQAAVKAALANSPGWVTKVVRRSDDWKTAVIWIGPPYSEWVSEIRLQWNDELGLYELESESYIGYDDEP